MSFDNQYSKIKKYASEELFQIEKNLAACINIKEPLNSDLKIFLTMPSKRIRSVLPVLYFKTLNESISDTQIELLSIVELVHNASLIHDDIIDESDFRRGEKTINASFGPKLGVIAGDYLLSVAMDKIAMLNSFEILKRFIFTIQRMCIGEINQNFAKYKIGTIEDYIEKSKNKTGFLFQTAFVCCAILSGKAYDLESIERLGLNIGIAFQIRDDIINLTKTDFSKPAENDITSGIYNAPIIYSGSVENYSDGIEKTRGLLNNYIEKARADIVSLPNNVYKKQFDNFLELLRYE